MTTSAIWLRALYKPGGDLFNSAQRCAGGMLTLGYVHVSRLDCATTSGVSSAALSPPGEGVKEQWVPKSKFGNQTKRTDRRCLWQDHSLKGQMHGWPRHHQKSHADFRSPGAESRSVADRSLE